MRQPGCAMVVTFSLLLSACAGTLSKQECLQGGWYGMGYRAGINGKSRDNYYPLARSCQKHGKASGAKNEYFKGWTEGNAIYCSPGNGFAAGRQGLDYDGVCAGGNETAFLNAYVQGVNVYTIEVEINGVKRQILQLQQKLLAEISRQRQIQHELQHDIKGLKRQIRRLRKQPKRPTIQ